MPSQLISMAVSLFFVINVLGNIPLFIGLLARYSPRTQRIILLREFSLALLILLLFNFFGSHIFQFLGITPPILGMAGGILLLLIAIGMIFPRQSKEAPPQHEPILVPLATPVIAGPGSIASVMLFASRLGSPLKISLVITITITLSLLIALGASTLKHKLGEKGLIAFERLGGMIISLIAVQMFASGAVEYVRQSFNI